MCHPCGWVVGPQTSLNKAFSADFPFGGFSRNRRKLSKMDIFLPRFIIKVGMTASVGN